MKLTDEKITEIRKKFPLSLRDVQFARAIEAAVLAQGEPYDKTEMNAFVQNLYDQKMREGKHGHYETMFHVVHQAIKRAHPDQQSVRVGHLHISRYPESGIWLRHDNGEAMQTDEDKLYQHLSEYWHKEF